MPDADVQDLVKISLSSVVTCSLDDVTSSDVIAAGDLLIEVINKDTTVATFDLVFQVNLDDSIFYFYIVCMFLSLS